MSGDTGATAITSSERATVEALFDGVRAGSNGIDAMLDLFAADAIVLERGTGDLREHRGQAKIRVLLAYVLRDLPRGLRLRIDRIERETSGELRADWTAMATIVPLPWRGSDYVTLAANGQIARLEIVLEGQPRAGAESPAVSQ